MFAGLASVAPRGSVAPWGGSTVAAPSHSTACCRRVHRQGQRSYKGRDIECRGKEPPSKDQLAEARNLLGVSRSEAGDRVVLNRARRHAALRYHPDKALPINIIPTLATWLGA